MISGFLAWIAVFAAGAHADGGPTDVCTTPCPKTTEVSVLVTTEEFQNKFSWNMATGKWYSPPSGVATGDKLVVRNASELRAGLIALAAQCKRIKHLAVFSHGDNGYVAFD